MAHISRSTVSAGERLLEVAADPDTASLIQARRDWRNWLSTLHERSTRST